MAKWLLATGNLEKLVTFMVRQAHHERNLLIKILPFAQSLSKCEVFRGSQQRENHATKTAYHHTAFRLDRTFNYNGSRDNTLDRKVQRLAPLDVNGIRRQSENEGWAAGQ